MKPTLLSIIIALFICITINGQEIDKAQTIDSGTIENQFDYLINKSNRYQDYKVVKRVWLDRLKKVVDDSLNVIRIELKNTKVTLSKKEAEISVLSDSLNDSKKTVTSLNNEKDSIQFFGILLSKPFYNSILWSVISALLVFLLFYIIRFNQKNKITKDSNEKFDELEKEFEEHRQRSLEREQQLRRKLQDELNKQKKEK